MATIKSYTSLEQSKKLAEFLPLESADMSWVSNGLGKPFARTIPIKGDPEELCGCWSLAALINILPVDWWDYNKHYFLEISKMGDISKPNEVRYYRFREQSDGADFGRITHISFQSNNLVDACYEMIIKLKELKIL